MPYRYPPEFRRKVLDLIAAGRPVASIASDLGVSDQTISTHGASRSWLTPASRRASQRLKRTNCAQQNGRSRTLRLSWR